MNFFLSNKQLIFLRLFSLFLVCSTVIAYLLQLRLLTVEFYRLVKTQLQLVQSMIVGFYTLLLYTGAQVLSLDHEIESNADYVNGFESRLKNLTDAISSEVEATDLVSSTT